MWQIEPLTKLLFSDFLQRVPKIRWYHVLSQCPGLIYQNCGFLTFRIHEPYPPLHSLGSALSMSSQSGGQSQKVKIYLASGGQPQQPSTKLYILFEDNYVVREWEWGWLINKSRKKGETFFFLIGFLAVLLLPLHS